MNSRARILVDPCAHRRRRAACPALLVGLRWWRRRRRGGFTCDVADQKSWLRSYMGEWYFWYRLSPSPDPAPYATLDDYFDALLYKGGTAPFPSDRFSYFETTESFNRFFGDGQTLGYGLSVAGLEVHRLAGQPAVRALRRAAVRRPCQGHPPGRPGAVDQCDQRQRPDRWRRLQRAHAGPGR